MPTALTSLRFPPPSTPRSPTCWAARSSRVTLLPARREQILDVLRSAAVWFEPTIAVTDCRDSKDNKYLELALAAGAETIVSSDEDLLVLHPWRRVHILRPADYLTFVAGHLGARP